MREDLPLYTVLSFDRTRTQDLIIPVLELKEVTAWRDPWLAGGATAVPVYALGHSDLSEFLYPDAGEAQWQSQLKKSH